MSPPSREPYYATGQTLKVGPVKKRCIRPCKAPAAGILPYFAFIGYSRRWETGWWWWWWGGGGGCRGETFSSFSPESIDTYISIHFLGLGRRAVKKSTSAVQNLRMDMITLQKQVLVYKAPMIFCTAPSYSLHLRNFLACSDSDPRPDPTFLT